MWKSSHWQFCYLNYIINLIVQVFLFYDVLEMKKVRSCDELKKFEEINKIIKWKFWFFEFFDKFHNIIINTHNSADYTAEFQKLASRMISLDNHTQWNSWYLSLVMTDKYKSSIDTYIKNYFENLSENYFISQDWKRFHIIMSFLQSFHQAILKT